MNALMIMTTRHSMEEHATRLMYLQGAVSRDISNIQGLRRGGSGLDQQELQRAVLSLKVNRRRLQDYLVERGCDENAAWGAILSLAGAYEDLESADYRVKMAIHHLYSMVELEDRIRNEAAK